MKDEEIVVVFPDGLLFRAYVRMLSIPYSTQTAKKYYDEGGLHGCFTAIDYEAELASNFRGMTHDDRIKALRALKWEPRLSVWLLPADHRMTIGDVLARRAKDLDLKGRPYSYTQDDWDNAQFKRFSMETSA